ncbi:MAG: hypothetical protein WD071_03815 [Pseudohongiella sp.]|uniref:hypothetical protein n=1 Tax=Pseudohongiella sp. TaxID=1979412 RepID=UPI00349FDC42
MVIFSLVLALMLLVGIIYILRRHHERIRQDVVERDQPLPPLVREVTPVTTSTETTAATSGGDWRQRCQILRDQGQYDAALAACQQAWPQWQSFDHAARVIRAAIRNTDKDSAEYQQWLHRLYRLAAQASFLHDKIDGLPAPTRQTLGERFNPQALEKLSMPWSDIGYRELRLLTKSDRKQLLAMLGEPKTNKSARIFHDKQWLTSIS